MLSCSMPRLHATSSCIHHHVHELFESDLWDPAEDPPGFRGVTTRLGYVRRPQQGGVADNVVTIVEVYPRKRCFAKVAHRMALTCRDDVIAGHLVLQRPPHRIDVVAGKTPVAPNVQGTQRQLALPASRDPCGTLGDAL